LTALILTGELGQREKRGRMVGAFFSSAFFASLIGVFLSGILPWRQLFILPAIFAIINLILVMFFFNFQSKARYDFNISYAVIMKDKRYLRIFTYILVLSLVYHSIYNWLGVYFSSLNFPQLKVSLLLSLVGFSGIFGQGFGGWITDKKGRVFAATCGLVLLSSAVFLLARPFSFFYLTVVLFVFGFGWTMNHNAVSTVLTDFPDNLRPELASLNSAVRFASGGLGVSLAGVFMRKSFALTFLGLGAIILFSAVLTNRILK
jgi:DHA1 family purine base/nucleoside efflux pump-like MFS transporter